MRLDRALDRFDGDMARRNCSRRSRNDYFSHLRRLFEHVPGDPQTSDVTPDAICDCLDEWANASATTRYKVDAMFRSFCKWLYFNDLVERNPMDKLPRPKRTHPDDVPLRAVARAPVPLDTRLLRLTTGRGVEAASTASRLRARMDHVLREGRKGDRQAHPPRLPRDRRRSHRAGRDR